MKYLRIFFLCQLLCCPRSHGMAYDGVHQTDDYQALSFSDPRFNAACRVDVSNNGFMTGVLVHHRVVMTAAHGIESLLSKRARHSLEQENAFLVFEFDDLYVVFERMTSSGKKKSERVRVVYAIVDFRYFNPAGSQRRTNRFDFAYLVLENSPTDIQPVPLFRQKKISNQALLTVVSYGNSDQSSFFLWSPLLRRAFRLYERDPYVGGVKDPEFFKNIRYLQESSLFFKPSALKSKPQTTEPEEIVRSYDATQNWINDQKKPYALALPGTSGAPVFVHLKENSQENLYVFGLISSFAHLSGIFDHSSGKIEMEKILIDPVQAQNQYQTIFSLPYKNVVFFDQQTGLNEEKIYVIDDQVSFFIRRARDLAYRYDYFEKKKNDSYLKRLFNFVKNIWFL